MVTMVLLNVALMWATPRLTLRRCLRFLLLATVNGPCLLVDFFVSRSALVLDALLARDGLARALAGARVGPGALPADRQAAPVPEPAEAADVAQAGDVLLRLAGQRPLGRVLAVVDVGDPGGLLSGQLLRPAQGGDPRLLAHLQGRRRPDADDVAQGDVRRLVGRQVHTENTRHVGSSSPGSALALLVTRVLTDHQQLAMTPNQLALLTDPLD